MTGRLAAGALVAVVVAIAVIVLSGGDDRYYVDVPLANASGLKDGSPVRVGGLAHGSVDIRVEDGDQIVARLRIDDDQAPLRKEMRVVIASANFLGQKRVEVVQGKTGETAPDGYRVPAVRVTSPTDLDQVLSVLDADTRTRTMILLNEAGEAVTGRKTDINTLLREFPMGFEDFNRLLAEVSDDTGALRALVKRSDGFVGEAVKERKDLVRMIDTLGETSRTVADKRGELRATLARAPGTLQSLRGFLTKLQSTATDLGPAARDITAAAPALSDTLGRVEQFRKDAGPALDAATAVAPDLTRLGVKATPVIKRARTPSKSLETFSRELVPVTDTLDKSADNIIAVLENWSRAIQFRDGLSHVFRGEASFSPDAIQSAVGRLTPPAKRGRDKRDKRPAAQAPADAPQTTAPAPGNPAPAKPRLPVITDLLDKIQLPKLDLQPLPDTLKGTLDKLQPSNGGGQQKDAGSVKSLLDFLLKP